MVGDKFKPTLEVPVKTIPWDKSGSYFKRVFRWLCYTRQWKFSEDWYFRLFDGTWVKIRKGFELDGVSVPKPFRFLLQPTGILFIPGIIHDYGYRHDKLIGVAVKESANISTTEITFTLEIVEEFDYYSGMGRAWWDYMFKLVGHQVTRFYLIPNITYLVLMFAGSFAWRRRRKQDNAQIGGKDHE